MLVQIGSADSMSDLPQAAEQFEVNVQAGDVVVLGTDGLWDNCFDEEVSRRMHPSMCILCTALP